MNTIPLLEGKSLADLRQGMTGRDTIHLSPTRGQAAIRRTKYGRAKRAVAQYDYIRIRTRFEMMDSIKKYNQKRINKRALEYRMRAAIKDSMKELFAVGIWTSGVEDQAKKRPYVTPEEIRWLKSAMARETKFLTGFIKDIVKGRHRVPIPRRVDMYLDTLFSLLQSGKAIAAPPNTLMYWVTKKDGRVCQSCEFMAKNSPYTKFSIPTVVRAGDTLCLTNCRCKVVHREVSPIEFERVQKRQKSKAFYIRNLRRIQRRRSR